MKKFLIILSLIFYSVSANLLFANEWQIDKNKSSIEFSGAHSGNNFIGKFDDISGEIKFDPNNLTRSFAKIKINLKSAKTGNQTYDKTLPQSDWFDVVKYPFALYETKKITRVKADNYKIEGFLTIKNIRAAHNFNAHIKITGDKAILTARTEIKRLDFNIGKTSDPDGSWVSLNIPLQIFLNADLKK